MLPLCILQQQTIVVVTVKTTRHMKSEDRETNCTNEKKETWVSGTLICHTSLSLSLSLPKDANLKPTNVNENVIVVHLRMDGDFFIEDVGPAWCHSYQHTGPKKIRG